jgi:hypothetical protein
VELTTSAKDSSSNIPQAAAMPELTCWSSDYREGGCARRRRGTNAPGAHQHSANAQAGQDSRLEISARASLVTGISEPSCFSPRRLTTTRTGYHGNSWRLAGCTHANFVTPSRSRSPLAARHCA